MSRYRGLGSLSSTAFKALIINTLFLGIALAAGSGLFYVYHDKNSPESFYKNEGYTLLTGEMTKKDKAVWEGQENIFGATTYLATGDNLRNPNFDNAETREFIQRQDTRHATQVPIKAIQFFGSSMTVTFENGCEVTRTWDIARSPGKIYPTRKITEECDDAKRQELPPYS